MMTKIMHHTTFLLSADPNITDLLQREHLQILAGMGVRKIVETHDVTVLNMRAFDND